MKWINQVFVLFLLDSFLWVWKPEKQDRCGGVSAPENLSSHFQAELVMIKMCLQWFCQQHCLTQVLSWTYVKKKKQHLFIFLIEHFHLVMTVKLLILHFHLFNFTIKWLFVWISTFEWLQRTHNVEYCLKNIIYFVFGKPSLQKLYKVSMKESQFNHSPKIYMIFRE